MVGDSMIIPGAYDARPRPVAVPNVVRESRTGDDVEPTARRRELPGWLKASIFAATLLIVMWLSMAVFFQPAP
jgi:hypothetical protein